MNFGEVESADTPAPTNCASAAGPPVLKSVGRREYKNVMCNTLKPKNLITGQLGVIHLETVNLVKPTTVLKEEYISFYQEWKES
jgi:hypothetical protein